MNAKDTEDKNDNMIVRNEKLDEKIKEVKDEYNDLVSNLDDLIKKNFN